MVDLAWSLVIICSLVEAKFFLLNGVRMYMHGVDFSTTEIPLDKYLRTANIAVVESSHHTCHLSS